jgi:hypothetical protein
MRTKKDKLIHRIETMFVQWDSSRDIGLDELEWFRADAFDLLEEAVKNAQEIKVKGGD